MASISTALLATPYAPQLTKQRVSYALTAALDEIDPLTGLSTARRIADRMVLAALGGDMSACREIMDRTEGKVAATVQGANGGPIEFVVRWQSGN